jgi:hypothetical protein
LIIWFEAMTAFAVTPQRWETRVIHLNIANTPPGPPAPAPAPQQEEPPTSQRPLFSETYLKQEFPDHYSPPQQPGSDQSQHPAVQLQGFINGLGQEGWEFVGVFPIGQLVMMFFRRPLPVEAQPEPAVESAASSQQDVLQQILQRLEALEGASAPRRTITTSSQAPARVLNPIEQDQLPPAPSLPTQHAATAMGLRSAGGLLTFGARHGFPPGLVKLVSNGMAAVYLGTEKRQRGGRSIRLWKVLPQSALPPQ